MPPGVLMSAAPCLSLTLETCLILPDTPSAHTHTHTQKNTISHTRMNVNTHRCIHRLFFLFVFLFHVHLDTEHLTASGAVTSRKENGHNKEPLLCYITAQRSAGSVLFVWGRRCRERNRQGNPSRHTHTHTHTHTPEPGEDQNMKLSVRYIHQSEIWRLHPSKLFVGKTTK